MSAYESQYVEAHWLAFFHTAVRELGVEARLPLLQRLSQVVVPAPDGWRYEEARERPAISQTLRLDREQPECFGCLARDRKLYWHHVIAVQHHGSNGLANLVSICYQCHRAIHPFMAERTREEERRPVLTPREPGARYEVLPLSCAPPGEIGEAQPYLVTGSLEAARLEARELVEQCQRGEGPLRYEGRPYGVCIYRVDGCDEFIAAFAARSPLPAVETNWTSVGTLGAGFKRDGGEPCP